MKRNTHSQKAKEYGIDLTLIEANLKLSYSERIKALERALKLCANLKEAGEKYYARLRKPSKYTDKE